MIFLPTRIMTEGSSVTTSKERWLPTSMKKSEQRALNVTGWVCHKRIVAVVNYEVVWCMAFVF